VEQGLVAWESQAGLAGIRFLDAPRPLQSEFRQEFHQWFEQDFSSENSDAALPLFSCASQSSTNAFDATLHLFACSAMALTGAAGVAIALGDSNGVECRASVGSAPDVGTKLRPDSGLSGQGLRTGAVILCDDAWSDSRVNTAAAKQMDARSFVVLPITVAENVVGLLEAFSRDTKYFSNHHLKQLQPLVNVLAEAINEQAASGSEAPVAPSALEPLIPEQNIQSSTPAPPTLFSVAPKADAEKNVETIETETASVTRLLAYSRLANRPAVIAAAVGIVLALLVFIAVLSRFTSRSQIESTQNSGAKQPIGNANEQGIVSAAKPTISFNPPVINQKVGATFNVDVVLKVATNVWSAPMHILYDSQKLQLVTVTSGELFDRDGQAATLVHRVDPSAGRIDISISRPLSAPGINGEGVVFTLLFLSKASGSSRLRVDQTGLRDTSTKVVSVNSSDAIVTISESSTPAESVGDHGVAEARNLLSPPESLPRSVTATEPVPRADVNNSAEAVPISKPALVVEGLPGTQIVVDNQASATISADGSARLVDLSSGKHQLRLTLQGYQDQEELINVVPGKTLTINDALLPVQPLTKSLELKFPIVAPPASALLPRPPGVPNFVLDRTLKGHSNWVTALAFSADGEHLISGSWDHSVKLWDVATGRALNTIASKVTGIEASALSHDGRLIAAEDSSDGIRIWSATTGKEVRVIKGDKPPWDESWVYSIAFSPDDSLLAAALDGKTVRLWDVNSGRAVRDVTGNPRTFIYMAFSPNGRWLATGGDSKTIEIVDVATGKVSKTLKGHKQDIYAVAFSPDGRWLASASKDKTVKVWEVSTGREVHNLTGHESSVTSLAFSPNSRWLASSGWDKTVRIWDVETGREVQTLTGHDHQIYSLAFDFRGGWLATGSADGTIKLWRLRKDIDLAVLGEENGARATSVAPSLGHAK
jgi:WD40 repeat protein